MLNMDSKCIKYGKDIILKLLDDKLISELYVNRDDEKLHDYVNIC